MTVESNELGVFHEDLAVGHVAFVVATRPERPLELTFEEFVVDGLALPLSNPGKLPAEQGIWIDVGRFTTGKEIEVHWRFRTGIRVPDDQVIIGHCPNFRISKLVRLEMKVLEPFTNYEGTFRVVPVKP